MVERVVTSFLRTKMGVFIGSKIGLFRKRIGLLALFQEKALKFH
jgi:hypothetical protein